MRKIRYFITTFFIFAILTVAANAAILHFGYGISWPDMAKFAAGALGISAGDSSSTWDSSLLAAVFPGNGGTDIPSGDDNTHEGDSSSRGDSSSEGSRSSAAEDIPTVDRSSAGDSSSADNRLSVEDSLKGDSSPKWDSSSEAGHAGADSAKARNNPDGSIIEMAGAFEIFNKLSLNDKIAIAEIAAKIGTDGIKKIYEISRDGITSDEILYITKYIQDHLQQSDIEKLEDIVTRNSHLYAATGD